MKNETPRKYQRSFKISSGNKTDYKLDLRLFSSIMFPDSVGKAPFSLQCKLEADMVLTLWR